jgi:ABC-type nitrate/sulfonate/bicarbonate transport system substrate-binding protein
MFKRILVGIILAIIIAAGLYWFGQNQSPRYTGPVIKATLGAETSLLPAAVWVAENIGYFEEEGLDLIIKEFSSGRLSFLDMLDGGVDISTVAPTPIMFNSFDRQDFSIFATFVYSDDDVKVIVRKDKGINTAADLKGKKVGASAGTTGQFFLASFLTHRGLDESDIEVVDISPSDLPDALDNEEVDAIVVWEPHAYNAQQLLADNATRLPSSDVYRETFNFMVMNDFAENNPETLIRFLKAIDRATTFIKTNQVEAQNMVAEKLELDQQVMSVLWNDFVFDISLAQSLLLTLEDEARWAIKNNLTNKTEIPNYLDYIHFDALETVDLNAVKVIK